MNRNSPERKIMTAITPTVMTSQFSGRWQNDVGEYGDTTDHGENAGERIDESLYQPQAGGFVAAVADPVVAPAGAVFQNGGFPGQSCR